MTEVFKCGDIANIINDNKTIISPKKVSKLSKKFRDIIEENQNKVIPINKKQKSTLKEDHKNDTNFQQQKDVEEVSQTEDNPIKRENEDHFEKNAKNERTIFVGNLPKTITSKVLKKTFKSFGRIESIRLRGAVPQNQKMPKKVAIITKSLHSFKDNINAYIVFKSKDDVLEALKLNGTLLEGNHIRVDSAIGTESHDNSRSVFVGNLPFIIKEEELYEFFKDCGHIEAVRVIRDSYTGVGKGFAFILFQSKDSVVLALEKNEMTLKGREIRITPSKANKSKHKSNKTNKRKLQNRDHLNETIEKSSKKLKKLNSKPEFEGISAKKKKIKTNKKKEIQSKTLKKKQKKLAQIFSHSN